jgi:hypothetical protein
MIVRGDSPEHGQLEVGMRVYPTRHHQLTRSIDHLGAWPVEVLANFRDPFPLNQNIGSESLTGCN